LGWIFRQLKKAFSDSCKPFLMSISLVMLAFFGTRATAASIEYLYIEASEGNSSGGHVALQLDDEVFHYQHHDSGLIRLLRQDKQEFHFLYRFLQNRPMHLSRIEVSEQTFQLLKTHFKLQFLAQEQQFKQLQALHKDRLLLRRWLYKQTANTDFYKDLRLNAVGLFYSEPVNNDLINTNLSTSKPAYSDVMAGLQQRIVQHYGQDYLARRHTEISAKIKALSPSHWPIVGSMLSSDNFPPAVNPIADSYMDALTGLIAIKVLQEGRSLTPDAVLITKEPVTGSERVVLEKFREQLTLQFINAFSSERSDWGHAVLVNIAKLTALELTLQSGHWVFVDDFGPDTQWMTAEQFDDHAAQTQRLIIDARANFRQTRQDLLAAGDVSEANYSQLEMAANRYFELLKGNQKQPVRFIGEQALPSKSIALPDWLAPNLTPVQLTTALHELEHYESQLFEELSDHYRYDLLTRNCVTELFRTINQALLSDNKTHVDESTLAKLAIKEPSARLGGIVTAEYNFIPFLSYQSVQQHYKVTASADLNSFRQQQLTKLLSRDNGWLAAINESNTFSSSLYDYNSDDAFFVFFTDDNWPVRPIFGLVNTTAGIGQSVFGLFSAPFDAGKNLESGLTGVLMSLPELAFFNMRKGSYKYLSYAQFLQDEKL
jgi:hypothetical protein